MADIQALTAGLSHPDRQVRLDFLRQLGEQLRGGELPRSVPGRDVNNHIHTIYSFSPYTPASAAYHAYRANLKTAGIMDHDSPAGAREFIAAGEEMSLLTTCGVECRVDMSDTALAGRRFNNPDQDSIAYVALHGIPHQNLDKVRDWFVPFTRRRLSRSRKMTERLSAITGIDLDFDRDVLPLSESWNGGSVTERHILFALAKWVAAHYPARADMLTFLTDNLKVHVSAENTQKILDGENAFYEYDLMGAMKSGFLEKIYIPATDECPPVRDFVRFAKEVGAIPAYAYLGDVTDSVTGDKKAQRFEDDYLEELFTVLRDLSFAAVTYMPSRNTMAQLTRVMELCRAYQFFEISGEDINSPHQSFVCAAQRAPAFSHLYDAALALCGHERAASGDMAEGMFSEKTLRAHPDLSERIEFFKEISEQAAAAF